MNSEHHIICFRSPTLQLVIDFKSSRYYKMILNNWNLPTLHWYSVTVNILSFFACLSSFTLEAGNQFKSIRHVWCLLFLPCFKRTQFCFGNKTLQNNQKHTHQITNTHTDAPKRRHAHTHSLTHSVVMQGDLVKRPKSCLAFHFSCQVKTLVAAAAAGYCIGLLVTFHSVLVTFQQHPTTPTDMCSSLGI